MERTITSFYVYIPHKDNPYKSTYEQVDRNIIRPGRVAFASRSNEPTQSASELDTKAREHDFYYKYYRVNMRSLIHECAELDPTPHSVMRRLFTGALQK